ncbi:MAG: Ig-like domain-containing protein [Holophaga sp.]|nr:Ig-like domain-containing protein [Holophaga sp.]
MTPNRTRGVLVTLTLLAAALPPMLIGCSGSSSAPATASYNPAPAVVISGTSSTPATGPVTLTFTFSEAMTSFPASAVTVTGGTAATRTTEVNANQYTLVVTPPSTGSGTMRISVAAGAFTDAAGVANTAAASVSQTYNTTPLTYTVLDFNSTLPSGEAYNENDFNGDTTTLVSTGYPTTGLPAGTGPVVAQIVTPAVTGGSAVYNGTYLGVGYENSVGALPFFASTSATTPQATKMSVVLYSPVAGVDIKLKIENASNSAQSVETDQTAALGWQTLVFDFGQPATGTAALNAAYTYNSAIIFPDFGATTATSATYYVGPITFIGESAASAPPLSQPGSEAYTILDFNATLPSGEAYNYLDFNYDVTTLVSTGYPATGLPTGTGPVVAQIAAPAVSGGSAVYNGTYLGVGYENSVGALPFFASTSATTPQATQVSMVLYAPVAGVDIKLKIQNADNTSQSVETDQTTAQGWQTLVFDFATPATGTAALNAAYTYNSPILFPNFGATSASGETYFVGPLTFIGASAPLSSPLATPAAGNTPTAGAPAPTLTAGSYIMLWNSSNTYSTTTIGNWNPSWGQSGAITSFPAGSATFWLMDLINYQGIDISGPNGDPTDAAPAPLSINGKLHLHISYWTPDGTAFSFYPVDATNTQQSSAVSYGSLVQNTWTDLELNCNLSGFDPTTLRQLVFSTTATEHIYLDNIYFH